MDATNSGAIGKDKVCAATTQLGYPRTDLTEFDLEKYGETGAISEVMDFHTGLADMQSVVGSSTGKKAHDMISKQLHGLGDPLWLVGETTTGRPGVAKEYDDRLDKK